MEIRGKTIILTGARRIGQAVAIELAKKGANLALTYLESENEVEAICAECRDEGVVAKAYHADLSKEDEIKRFVSDVKKDFGNIDTLIHLASNYPKTPFGEISQDEFHKNLDIIAASALLLGQETWKELKLHGGKIIFISDWSVLTQPYPDYVVYNMAKASIESLTKTLAKALAPEVTVNAIAPGPILRPPDLSEAENKEVMENTPLRKWGGKEEIAKAVLYLLDADFVTGIILPVDGGRSIA